MQLHRPVRRLRKSEKFVAPLSCKFIEAWLSRKKFEASLSCKEIEALLSCMDIESFLSYKRFCLHRAVRMLRFQGAVSFMKAESLCSSMKF